MCWSGSWATVTPGVSFAATQGNELIIFEVNPLHNLVHLAVGGLLIGGAAAGVAAARSINILVGAVYLVVGLVGFFIIGTSANILALNQADNGLHLVSAVAALGVGMSQRTVAIPAR